MARWAVGSGQRWSNVNGDLHLLGVHKMSDLLDHLGHQAGVLQSDSRLVGHAVVFGKTDDDRSKASAWLSLDGDPPGAILVWESGEVELEAGYAVSAKLDVAEHHDIQEVAEIDALLERLIVLITEGSTKDH